MLEALNKTVNDTSLAMGVDMVESVGPLGVSMVTEKVMIIIKKLIIILPPM